MSLRRLAEAVGARQKLDKKFTKAMQRAAIVKKMEARGLDELRIAGEGGDGDDEGGGGDESGGGEVGGAAE